MDKKSIVILGVSGIIANSISKNLCEVYQDGVTFTIAYSDKLIPKSNFAFFIISASKMLDGTINLETLRGEKDIKVIFVSTLNAYLKEVQQKIKDKKCVGDYFYLPTESLSGNYLDNSVKELLLKLI